MAEYTQAPQRGFAPHAHPEYAVAAASPLGQFTNVMGAVVSLALVVGVGVWGYKLLVRDVSGIPVVRATDGDMRVRPEEPGGEFARHQGLSVNSVAAVGAADGRAEQLRLAPEPIALTEEDQPASEIAEMPADDSDASQGPAPAASDVAEALESGLVDSLVAQLTQGVAPLDPLEAESAPVLASLEVANAGDVRSTGGLRASLRPSLRPGRAGRTVSVPPAVSNAAPAATTELDAASLPVGTRLVQLGAFDTPEIARAQWGALNARFAPFMEGKSRVVMQAESGGRTFYRLRAAGFSDIADARRFCSALVAESVDCIPVVTR